jgi:uncharacterized membrane protein
MKIIRSIVIGIAMVSFAGCTNMSHKQQGTLSGAAIGAAAGAGIGALAKSVEGVGIDEKDLITLRDETTEGTSVLLAVTQDGDLDRLGERFHGLGSRLVATNLTEAEKSLLLETFG